MRYYVLVDRRPVATESVTQWAAALEHNRVAETELSDGSWVSTIFLGIDHRLWGKGPSILFETIAFKPDGEVHEFDGSMARYASWSDAEAGHAVIVRRAEEFLKLKV